MKVEVIKQFKITLPDPIHVNFESYEGEKETQIIENIYLDENDALSLYTELKKVFDMEIDN